jgi:hypothetical protein
MKMMVLILSMLLISGCGTFDRAQSALTGNASKICIGGVEYLQFTSGTSVAYTPDGRIKTCDK